ncbi:Na+/H+ antiporter subunit D [Bacillus litorisediminis]|uniref:Na+/H+ antiporter subunit D n=1 Tax=Bacillus litorisediminis TaxID=2922713 RepID=UPI001FAF74F5|nr:Na+/H+ antiporter subunit D [Bacillus litorisediminis]
MTNLLIYPLLIPLLTAILLIFFKNIYWLRTISIVSTALTVFTAGSLIYVNYTSGIQALNLSNWEAPFGITLVSDMLSALLVTTSSVITLLCLIYSFRSIGKGREKYYYYSVVQFLLLGVNGAFTTGDIFNLFVFFEVMLMSSYVLIVLGGTKIQLRESLKYLLVNVISSALFVIAVAYLYSVVGTLNMAHLSVRISEIPTEQTGILTVIAVLFLIVFGLKGAIFPLFFWLPGSYYAPPIPVMALFGALLTKVGVYSIMRTYTLIFHHDLDYTHSLLGSLALLTIMIGVIGAIAYSDLKKIVIYNIMVAVGVILFGVSTMTDSGLTGSVFYLIHDMIIKAALFLLIGVIIAITGTSNLRNISGLIHKYPLLAWTFFVAALSLAGIPPLSGFIGKILIVQGGFEEGELVGSLIVIFSSLFVLFSVMKIFINGFWGTPRAWDPQDKAPVQYLIMPCLAFVMIAVLYGFGAGVTEPFISKAAESLIDPSVYVDAVLKE